MRTFSQELKATQSTAATRRPGPSHFGQRSEVFDLRPETKVAGLGHDFGRIPVYGDFAERIGGQALRFRTREHALRLAEQGVSGADQPLPHLAQVQAAFGPEHDLSTVRARVGGAATNASLRMGAAAYTMGERVAFAREPSLQDAAHEAAHVVQQRRGMDLPYGLGPAGDRHERQADRVGRFVEARMPVASTLGPEPSARSAPQTAIQRRLIATGPEIASFIALAEPAMGVGLAHDPVTNEITAISSLVTPATSPTFAATLLGIINDPLQDAEINFGAHQARVAVGAYPSAGRFQSIDMDDVRAIEAGAPGSGIAKLGHEINENYVGHAGAPAGGMAAFGPAHAAGIATESAVASELVMPGNRVASVDVVRGPGSITRIQDFETYYLVFDRDRPTPGDSVLSNARHAPKVLVAAHTVDQFVTGVDALPAAGAATIAAAAADVAANPSATVLIEGFTDNVGSAADNLDLGRRRAEHAEADLVTAGVAAGRIHPVGRGETAFVTTNATPAGRAANRRVVISVTIPGP